MVSGARGRPLKVSTRMPMPGKVVVVDTAASTARRSLGVSKYSRALSWLERESRSVPVVAALAIPQLAGDWLLRAQSLTYVMFAALVWLLVADARSPSRRIALAFPLLLLWANLHGSVVIAAGLVALRGITVLAAKPRRTGRGLALVVVPWLCVFASPYATALPSYYQSIFFNHGLSVLAPAWGASSPSLLTAPFYVLAFGGLALLARRWKTVALFERLCFLVLLVAGMIALRNMVWFSLP